MTTIYFLDVWKTSNQRYLTNKISTGFPDNFPNLYVKKEDKGEIKKDLFSLLMQQRNIPDFVGTCSI